MSTNAVPQNVLQQLLQKALGQQQGNLSLSQPGATPPFMAGQAAGPSPGAPAPAPDPTSTNAVPNPVQNLLAQATPQGNDVQQLLASSGSGQGATPDDEMAAATKKALDKYVNGDEAQKKRSDEIDKMIKDAGEINKPPALAQQATADLYNLPNTDEWKQTKAKIAELQNKPPVDIEQKIKDQLKSQDEYVSNRQAQVYGGQNGMGKAAQFISDIFRKPGALSGVQAAYQQATDEYQKQAAEIRNQILAERNADQTQLAGSRAALQQIHQEAVGNVQTATLAEKQQQDQIHTLEKMADIEVSTGNFETRAGTADFQQAKAAWDDFSKGLTDQQVLRKLSEQIMSTDNIPQAMAQLKAKQIMLASQSLTRPVPIGSSSTQSINPVTLQQTTQKTNQYLNPLSRLGIIPGQAAPPATTSPAIPTQATPQSAPLHPLLQAAASGGISTLGQQIGNLQADPSKISMRGGGQLMATINNQAKQTWDARPWDEAEMGRAKPQWSPDLYRQVQAAEKDYGTGARSKQVDAFNTAMRHVDLLTQAAKALNTGNTQLFNRLQQMWSVQTGESPFTNAETIADRLGKEINKAYIPGGGGVGERSDAEKEFSGIQSPKQLADRINTNLNLLNGAAKTLQTRYKQDTLGTGTKQLINPDVQQILTRMHQDATATPQSGPDYSKFEKK